MDIVRSWNGYDTNAVSLATALRCDDPTLTKQSFKDECDINTIVRRFGLTGELPTNVRMPTFQDFDGIFDFRSVLDVIRSADESFAAMPAEVRARFGNDAASFVDFCSDSKNLEEAKKLGLVKSELVKSDSVSVPSSLDAKV